MKFREAKLQDIEEIQAIRNSINENVLSDQSVITTKDYENFISANGKTWICEVDDTIAGFSIVDLKNNTVLALFVKPEFEKKGIGKELYTRMMDWYFDQTKAPAWLNTTTHTRAEKFYRSAGWVNTEINNTETKFEMTYKNWIQNG